MLGGSQGHPRGFPKGMGVPPNPTSTILGLKVRVIWGIHHFKIFKKATYGDGSKTYERTKFREEMLTHQLFFRVPGSHVPNQLEYYDGNIIEMMGFVMGI